MDMQGSIIRSIRTPVDLNNLMVQYAQTTGISINALYNIAVRAFLEGKEGMEKKEA